MDEGEDFVREHCIYHLWYALRLGVGCYICEREHIQKLDLRKSWMSLQLLDLNHDYLIRWDERSDIRGGVKKYLNAR